MSLMSDLEAYRNERLQQFDEAYETLRQELVDDLAKKYRAAGIPANFHYKSGRTTLEMKIAGGDEFTEALATGDEQQISNTLAALLAAFVAMRNQNAAHDKEDTNE